MNKKNTQKDMILKHLKDVGDITSWEAIKEYGATRLSAIIYTLKHEGHKFDEKWISSVNRYGDPVSFKKYIYKGV